MVMFFPNSPIPRRTSTMGQGGYGQMSNPLFGTLPQTTQPTEQPNKRLPRSPFQSTMPTIGGQARSPVVNYPSGMFGGMQSPNAMGPYGELTPGPNSGSVIDDMPSRGGNKPNNAMSRFQPNMPYLGSLGNNRGPYGGRMQQGFGNNQWAQLMALLNQMQGFQY